MSPQPSGLKLPKGTLKKLTLGQSFAEYDKLLEKEHVYVETPALRPHSIRGRGNVSSLAVAAPGKPQSRCIWSENFQARSFWSCRNCSCRSEDISMLMQCKMFIISLSNRWLPASNDRFWTRCCVIGFSEANLHFGLIRLPY
jgi:hypothetical protein